MKAWGRFYFFGGGGLSFAVSCKKRFRRGRSFAQSPMSQTKVTAPKHLKFRSSLFKGLQGRGTASSSLPQERNPQAHSNSKSKTIKRKAKLTNQKKRNAAKKSKTERSNENYYFSKTVNLHCANSILSKPNQPFSKFASEAEQILKIQQN